MPNPNLILQLLQRSAKQQPQSANGLWAAPQTQVKPQPPSDPQPMMPPAPPVGPPGGPGGMPMPPGAQGGPGMPPPSPLPQQPPAPPPQMPPMPPPSPAAMPNVSAKVPPRAQRFQNAQELEAAYANGWNPNPMLLRAGQTHF